MYENKSILKTRNNRFFFLYFRYYYIVS